MSATAPQFLEGEPITLKSGAIVAWLTFDVCEPSELRIRKWPQGTQKKCRNPWSLIEDGEERELVMSKRPTTQPLPGNQKTRLSLEYVEAAKIEDEIKSYLSADCWALYVTDKHRLLEVRQTYFDARTLDRETQLAIRAHVFNILVLADKMVLRV